MRGIKEYSIPETLDYTLKLLHMHQGKSLVVAGGSHLGLIKSSSNEIIVDIKKAGLSYIKEDDQNIIIGATTRAVEIRHSDLLKTFAGGIVSFAASNIGSVLTQNLVTIGGNVYSLLPWSNLPPALLVLDATVELASMEGKRTVSLSELLSANPRKYIENYEIISSISIPKKNKDLKTSYKVFNLTENDYDIVILAVSLDMDGKLCKKAKIALGAAISPCSLMCEAASLLENKELTDELIKAVAEKLVSGIKLLKDIRTTDEHRVDVIKTLVKRALEEHK
ncbi:MAG: xanthine dehydrogenase family protein subunit M [Vampirovibrionia bacterium]